MARECPDAYDFGATLGELERIYEKGDSERQLAFVYLGQSVLAENGGNLERAEALLPGESEPIFWHVVTLASVGRVD